MVNYTCNRCKKVFDHKGTFDRHINRKRKCKKLPRISPDFAPKNICPNCGQNCSRRYHLNRHLSSRCPVLKASCNWGRKSGQKFQTYETPDSPTSSEDEYMSDEYSSDSEGTKIVTDGTEIVTRGTKFVPPASNFDCKYCGKSLCNRKSLKRHFKTCKEKAKDDIQQHEQNEKKKLLQNLKLKESVLEAKEQEIKELRKIKEEKEKIEEEYFKFMKQVALKGSTNITYNDNKQKNMYFIMNNYKSAYDFKELMDPEISAAETRSIKRKGPTNGSYYLLSKRCITDIDVENRPFHCVDNSRNKYLLYTENDWKIDPNANKIIQTAVDKVSKLYDTDITRQDTIKSRDHKLVNISKLIDLEKVGKKRILRELNKNTSIKPIAIE